MVFVIPCFAAMGAIKREMNHIKWFWLTISYQTVLAYAASLCVYQIGTLFSARIFGIGTAAAVLLITGFIYLLFRPYKESSTLNVNMKKWPVQDKFIKEAFMGTVITAAVLVVFVGLAIRKMIQDKKNGKSLQCGCDCGRCGGCGRKP